MDIQFLLLGFISLLSFFNIFSYGYFPSLLFEGFLLVASTFIFILSISTSFKYKLPTILSFFLILNLFFLSLSSLAQYSMYPFSRGIGVILGISSFYYLGRNISKKYFFIYIKFFAICFYLALALCLYASIPTIIQYTGFFENPNQLGRLFSYFLVVFGVFMIKYRNEISPILSIQYYSIIFLSFVLMTISSSRGIILTSLIPFIIYLSYILFLKFKEFIKYKRKKDFINVILLLIFFFIMVFVGWNYYELVNSKSVFKILQRGDFTGGRIVIWSITLSQITNWGIDLFKTSNLLEYVGFDVHSTYLNFALRNGLIPSLIFFITLFFTLFKIIFKSNLNIKNNYFFVYFLSLQIFLYWIFESAFNILPFWLIFFFLAFESRGYKYLRQIN